MFTILGVNTWFSLLNSTEPKGGGGGMVGVGGTTSSSAAGYASPNDAVSYYLKSRGFNSLFSQIWVPFLLPSSSFLKPRFEFSNFHCFVSSLARSYRSLFPIYETATWCQRFVLLNGHSFDWRIFLETLLCTFGWVIWCRAMKWLLCILKKKEMEHFLNSSAVKLFWILWIING